MKNDDPYSYPNDGRGASDSPGLITDLLSLVDLPEYGVGLNSPVDRAISRHVIKYPYSPLTPILNCLFGRRGHR